MFLVLVGCGIDDIPMGLWETKEGAMAQAQALKESDVQKVAAGLFNRDVTVFHAVWVVKFMEWIPESAEMVRNLDDDENF